MNPNQTAQSCAPLASLQSCARSTEPQSSACSIPVQFSHRSAEGLSAAQSATALAPVQPFGYSPFDLSERLIPLGDGRSGLRATIQVQAQSKLSNESAADAHLLPVIDFVSSNATLDRYDEIIRPERWRLQNYRRNPVFQNAHQYGDIIFTLGKALITEVRLTPTPHLFQRIEFAVDVNPVARIAYGLYRNKFLNAVSVGFIPIR